MADGAAGKGGTGGYTSVSETEDLRNVRTSWKSVFSSQGQLNLLRHPIWSAETWEMIYLNAWQYQSFFEKITKMKFYSTDYKNRRGYNNCDTHNWACSSIMTVSNWCVSKYFSRSSLYRVSCNFCFWSFSSVSWTSRNRTSSSKYPWNAIDPWFSHDFLWNIFR